MVFDQPRRAGMHLNAVVRVAVGTGSYPPPPHRSVRAELPHTAPTEVVPRMATSNSPTFGHSNSPRTERRDCRSESGLIEFGAGGFGFL